MNTIYIKGFFGKMWQLHSIWVYCSIVSFPLAAGKFSTINPCEPIFLSWNFLPCNTTRWTPSTENDFLIIHISGVIETLFTYQLFAVGALANLGMMLYLPLSLKMFMIWVAK